MQAGREIKFRAWDKEDENMTSWESINLDFEYSLEQFLEMDRFVMMQFTGLRDKNGKEIYEGDILGKTSETSGLSYRYTVEWDSENARFMARGKHFQELVSDSLERGCKVIGNIYESPELLEVSK